MRLLYTAWFQEPSLPQDDQDFEWPACFHIDGATEDSIQGWGDQLSRAYANRNGQLFLRSTAEEVPAPASEQDRLPLVVEGQLATDDHIGW